MVNFDFGIYILSTNDLVSIFVVVLQIVSKLPNWFKMLEKELN